MKKYNFGLAVVSVSLFTGGKNEGKDKNGLQSVILTPLYGNAPSSSKVISGTVAQRSGLIEGCTYCVNFVENGTYHNEETGKTSLSFQVGVVKELSFTEILEAGKAMVPGATIDTMDVAVEETEATAQNTDLEGNTSKKKSTAKA